MHADDMTTAVLALANGMAAVWLRDLADQPGDEDDDEEEEEDEDDEEEEDDEEDGDEKWYVGVSPF
jgi:hypothetical protein